MTFPHEEEKPKKWVVRKATEYWISVKASTEEEAIAKADAAADDEWHSTETDLEAEEE